MIRLLTIDDLKAWAPVAAEYHASLNLPGVFKDTAFIDTWAALFALGRGFIIGRFVESTPREVVGVMVYDDPFTGDVSAGAMFWYQSGDKANLATGMVLQALLGECNVRQIKRLFVSISQRRIGNSDIETTLQNLGFRNVETQYMKDV